MGKVSRVDPKMLGSEFSKIMDDKIFGTYCRT